MERKPGRPTKAGPSVHQGLRMPVGLLHRIHEARGPRTLTDAILDALTATYDPPFNESPHPDRAAPEVRLPDRVGR